jgi:rhamnose transport system substrate-binding protein
MAAVRRWKWLAPAAMVVVALVLAACGSSSKSSSSSAAGGSGGASSSSSGGSSGAKLFMLPKFTGIPPFTQADNGAKQMASGFGYTLGYGGPTTASATQQVNFINTAVSQGNKGIFISADNPSAVTPALVRAQGRGVKVVSFDSDVLPNGRTIYVQGTSADSIAQTELDMLGSQIGYSGDFAILSAQATDSNQVQWNKILVQDLKSNPKYKNMHLVTIVNPPDDGTPSAVQYTQSLLKEHPTIKGIIAPTTVAVAAAAQVVKQQGLCNKYVVTGLGDPMQMKPYVTSGCVKKFALWNFTREGQVAMCAMHGLLTGKISGKEGESFTCGSLGSFKVEPQGTVTAGPATVFSKNNLSAYTF